MANGYDRFVERKHFAKPTHSTIWGVCDEDLYQRTLVELRELAKTGEFSQGDPKAVGMSRLTGVGAADEELQEDTIALLQVADDLHIHPGYRLDP